MAWPAHPRSRGENAIEDLAYMPAPGSSPLTRGKPPEDSSLARPLRLIPAHAGKTASSRRCRRWRTAHPRSRGENAEKTRDTDDRPGSSPLTRGKLHTARDERRLEGLIPAHAGKTGRQAADQRHESAHPRSRGENIIEGVDRLSPLGSSPLTRGKHGIRQEFIGEDGLIPAHAGKTTALLTVIVPIPAHPRSRGENTGRQRPSDAGRGSSPLTRGKPRPRLRSRSRKRLIPAHAGKTTSLLNVVRN